MKFSKKFKKALANLPNEEKDRLLLSLLEKDAVTAQRLKFELLDNKSVEDRREEMEVKIREQIQVLNAKGFLPHTILKTMHYLSGEINTHVKIAKDEFGEASLNLIMLLEVLKACTENIKTQSRPNSNLCVYIIGRSFKILVFIGAMPGDLSVELKEKLHQLGQLIGDNDKLMRTAIFHCFDVNWLLRGKIPNDIDELYKDLYARGYLQ